MMSDFLGRIIELISSPLPAEVNNGDSCSSLSHWNVDVEDFVQKTVAVERHRSTNTTISVDEHKSTGRTQCDHDSVNHTFQCLKRLLLDIAVGKTLNDARDDMMSDSNNNIERHHDSHQIQLEVLLHDWRMDSVAIVQKIHWIDMCILLRTAKNLWRWYIQIYLPSRGTYPSSPIDHRPDVETSWRSKRLLELIVHILEELSLLSSSEQMTADDEHLPRGPQYASQLFFYITYPLSSNDLNLMDSYHYVITECNLMCRFLNVLTRQTTSMTLRLSIIRNVHNALASFPQQSFKAVTSAMLKTSSTLKISSHVTWMNDDATVSYKSFLRDLAHYILSCSNEDLSRNGGDDIIFITSSNNNNTHEELIVEILRCSYALRIGTDSDMDSKWQVIIERVLDLDTTCNDHIRDSRLAVTCILMESATFRQSLSSKSIESLVQVLGEQVTNVLREKYIDDRAAAALNPILAVLYKSCIEHPHTLAEIIRQKVFPDDISDSEHDDETIEDYDAPKNMSPIDAPEGTLRWKLIQLLTWPNSFVKRLTGELLFLLCHNKQQEFIRRVGIGNAVAILSLKGLIDLPAAVHS